MPTCPINTKPFYADASKTHKKFPTIFYYMRVCQNYSVPVLNGYGVKLRGLDLSSRT